MGAHQDLEDFNDQLTEILATISSVLTKEIPRLKGQERTEKCQYLRNRLNRAKQVHRSILAELRSLPVTDRIEWEKSAKAHEEQMEKLGQDVEWAETTNDTKDAPKKKTIDEMTALDMTRQAMVVQDKTVESTTRAKKALDETLQVCLQLTDQMGAQTANELKRQGDKIKEVEEGIEMVESNLVRADKQMRIFIRKLAGDKIFMLMILLVVLGIIGAIAFAVLKKQCPSGVQPCIIKFNLGLCTK